jgi:hypothetical protein
LMWMNYQRFMLAWVDGETETLRSRGDDSAKQRTDAFHHHR